MAMTNAERQRRHRERVKNKLRNVTDNVTSLRNENELMLRIEKLEKCIDASNVLLDTMLEKLGIIESKLDVLRNELVTNSKVSLPNGIVTYNNESVTPLRNEDKLIFDLDKSKAIAKDLKVQGMTANQIAKELARRGFGNKLGKPFSKSSINKWKL